MHQNYVAGEWQLSESGETIESRNPAAVNNIVGEVQLSTPADAESAITAAVSAQVAWRSTPGPIRGKFLRDTATILEERKQEISETLVREEGKTWSEGAGEVQRAIDIFHYYGVKAADYGGDVKRSSSTNTHLYVRKEPVGVVSAITPWNYPIAIPAWKIAPAIATGNSVVFKPAAEAAVTGLKLVECLDEAGLPDGVVNAITGAGGVLGPTLTTDARIDAVSFTGSKSIGDLVYANAAGDQKRVQLEMGGKNPTVVMPDADLTDAVEIVGAGAFGVTGQACTACSRAIVHEDVYEKFVDGIVRWAEDITVGPGIDDPDMGPQASKEELDSSLKYIDIACDEGAILETGGSTLEVEGADGYFIEPTVFSGVDPDMIIAQEEVFGPVMGVIRVANFEEALDAANGVEQGLCASIVTNDLNQAHRFVDEADVGVVKVNEKTTGLDLHVPFGGRKASSSETYREQGDAGLEFYTIPKTVYMNY